MILLPPPCAGAGGRFWPAALGGVVAVATTGDAVAAAGFALAVTAALAETAALGSTLAVGGGATGAAEAEATVRAATLAAGAGPERR
jgi:hypothetical protein